MTIHRPVKPSSPSQIIHSNRCCLLKPHTDPLKRISSDHIKLRLRTNSMPARQPLTKRHWEGQFSQSVVYLLFNEDRPTHNTAKSPDSLKEPIQASRSDRHSIGWVAISRYWVQLRRVEWSIAMNLMVQQRLHDPWKNDAIAKHLSGQSQNAMGSQRDGYRRRTM
jgi:hypothetical protein